MVNRMRQSRTKTGMRRSHHGLSAPTLAECKNCGANHRPHHMCLECGFYNGRQVMDLAKAKAEREERLQKKREAIKAQADEMATAEAEANQAEETTKEEVSTEEKK